MKVFIAGASGAIGSSLVRLLQAEGHEVTGGSRRPERAAERSPGLAWSAFDVDTDEGMVGSLEGHDALVYLVHQMDGQDDLVGREADAAGRVVKAAEAAGVKRGVFLGSVQPGDGSQPSEHILARAVTGQVLRSGSVPFVELQASMVIGAASESWRIVRDLAARLPVMVLPAWLSRETRPVGIDDVLAAMAHAVTTERAESLAIDLPGPESLSVREVLVRTAAQMGRRPLMLSVPVLSPGLSAKWIHAVTRADHVIADHLVQGMLCDVEGKWPGYWELMPDHAVLGFDEATARALEACPPPDDATGRWVEALAARLALRA